MKKSLHQYVIATDPNGAICEGQPVAVRHRFIIADKTSALCVQSIAKRFHAERHFFDFIHAVLAAPSGTFGGISWEYDGDPVHER